jgi:hypothetical protein
MTFSIVFSPKPNTNYLFLFIYLFLFKKNTNYLELVGYSQSRITMSNATHIPLSSFCPPKIDVALKITIEFLIYHSWILIQW